MDPCYGTKNPPDCGRRRTLNSIHPGIVFYPVEKRFFTGTGNTRIFIRIKNVYFQSDHAGTHSRYFLYAFAALFIILDPLLSVPIFAAMTKGLTAAEIHW